MKRKTTSFTGTRPIFTGSPSIVPGGFNLDKSSGNFVVDDVIPAGTLAIRDEETRKVQVIKTAKISEVEDDKILNLHVSEFYAPFFAIGDKVLKSDAVMGSIDDAPSIIKIEEKDNIYRITLDKAFPTGKGEGVVSKGDVIVEVVADKDNNAKERGLANSITIKDAPVSEFETAIDVTADTMQYALFERRVAPIPTSQKDETGCFLKANPHVKLTKSM